MFPSDRPNCRPIFCLLETHLLPSLSWHDYRVVVLLFKGIARCANEFNRNFYIVCDYVTDSVWVYFLKVGSFAHLSSAWQFKFVIAVQRVLFLLCFKFYLSNRWCFTTWIVNHNNSGELLQLQIQSQFRAFHRRLTLCVRLELCVLHFNCFRSIRYRNSDTKMSWFFFWFFIIQKCIWCHTVCACVHSKVECFVFVEIWILKWVYVLFANFVDHFNSI